MYLENAEAATAETAENVAIGGDAGNGTSELVEVEKNALHLDDVKEILKKQQICNIQSDPILPQINYDWLISFSQSRIRASISRQAIEVTASPAPVGIK